VRKLEISGRRVVEVGVRHYPRLPTLYELSRLYLRLVVAPAFTGKDRQLA
jgi:hypothetical protein